VRKVRVVLNSTQTNVHTSRMPAPALMVTNAGWAMYTVRLGCEKLPATHQRAGRLRQIAPRTSMTLQTLKPGLAGRRVGLHRTLTISLNRSILFHSMLTIELVFSKALL
jgi:hypothetical protein